MKAYFDVCNFVLCLVYNEGYSLIVGYVSLGILLGHDILNMYIIYLNIGVILPRILHSQVTDKMKYF